MNKMLHPVLGSISQLMVCWLNLESEKLRHNYGVFKYMNENNYLLVNLINTKKIGSEINERRMQITCSV